MLGAPAAILSRPGKVAGAPAVASRFCSGSPPSPAKRDGNRRWGAASIISPWRASSTARARRSLRAARAASAARGAAGRALGHRHRALAARPLHDLCAAHPAARAPRPGRHGALRRRPRQRHSRRRRPLFADLRGTRSRPTPMRSCWRSDARNSRRSTTTRDRTALLEDELPVGVANRAVTSTGEVKVPPIGESPTSARLRVAATVAVATRVRAVAHVTQARTRIQRRLHIVLLGNIDVVKPSIQTARSVAAWSAGRRPSRQPYSAFQSAARRRKRRTLDRQCARAAGKPP